MRTASKCDFVDDFPKITENVILELMIYFVMARHNDARPIIEYFKLKKDMAPGPFTVFHAEDVVLCLSGDGVYSAAATAYILTRWGRRGLFVHLVEGPEVLYPHTIMDAESGIANGKTTGKEIIGSRLVIYQEMLYKPPDFVQEGILVSREAAYTFLAASKFLLLKQILVLQCKDCRSVLPWFEDLC